jgi:hypothetical protein
MAIANDDLIMFPSLRAAGAQAFGILVPTAPAFERTLIS